MGSYNQAAGKEHKRMTLHWVKVGVMLTLTRMVAAIMWTTSPGGCLCPLRRSIQRPPTLSLAPTPKPTTSSKESTTSKPSTTSHLQLLYKFQFDFQPGKHFLQTLQGHQVILCSWNHNLGSGGSVKWESWKGKTPKQAEQNWWKRWFWGGTLSLRDSYGDPVQVDLSTFISLGFGIDKAGGI